MTKGWADQFSAGLSALAVLGMLCGALVIVADVLLRWLAGSAVVALNEVMGQVFAMAVALTLPAGAVGRVNLKVDLLARHFGPHLTRGLAVTGSALLALFFAILAWKTWGLAVKYHDQGRQTLLLQWPLAPTYFVVSIAMGVAALAQVRNAVHDALLPQTLAGKTSPLGVAVVAIFALLLGAALVWAATDLRDLSGFAQTKPATFVLTAFGLLWLAVFAQIPLAAVSGLIGLGGTALFIGAPAAGNVMAGDVGEFLSNAQVATLPLFLMMGSFAVAAGISDDIYRLAHALLGRVRGGLAYATVAGCAGFGAVSGSSIATAATFGRIALPQMKARGYAPSFASGTVAAGGTLGALVPPSGAIILFALLTEQSIATLFVAAMVPALLALCLYFITIWIVVRRSELHDVSSDQTPLLPALRAALPVALLFGAVIGGLYGGVFTATESAAVGAVGAFLLAAARGRLSRDRFLSVMAETTQTTAVIYGLIFGALIFSFFVNMGQAPDMVTNWIGGLDTRPIIILATLVLFYLLLGAVMDSFAVMVITVPVVTPLVTGLGYDINYWGVLMLVVVEVGLITPPFGINLFVLKSLQPEVGIGKVMRGVLPFVLADVVKVALLLAFPALALWLPGTMQ